MELWLKIEEVTNDMLDKGIKLLQVSKLNCERNYLNILKNISFNLYAGEALLVRGKNGSGKTSLLLSVAGVLPYTGIVRFNVNIDSVGYVGHKNAVRLNETVEQYVQFWKNLYSSEVTIDEIINKFKLQDIYELPTHFLSFGQRKKLSFIRLFLLKTLIWLLDEPLTGLDKKNKIFISDMIFKHMRKGGAIILTSHENFLFPKYVRVKELTID